MTYDEISNWLQIITGIVLTLSFFAGIATIWITLKASAEKTDKVRLQDEKIAELTKDAEVLKIETIKLQKQLTDAVTKQVEAESKLLELQNRISPRKLSSAQSQALSNELIKHGKKAIEIIILGDQEASSYGTEIIQVIASSGWMATAISMGSMSPPRYGTIIVGDTANPTAIALMSAFKNANIEITTQNTPANKITLLVGLKPEVL